ncbi:MAG: IclR family transcriptional regulator [Actinomycetota bacterium]
MVAEAPSSTAPSTTPTGESPIERAFRVLQTVVAAGESLGVLELSRRSGLPRSTVSRLVATLTDLGMVARTADGAVVPGSALATLQPAGEGAAALLADRLRPLLAELVQTFGENAALSVDDGDALLYLTQVSADHAVSVPEVSGERHRFHLVAPGLVAMAHWEEARIATALAEPLEAATAHSMTDPGALRHRLEQVRADGYCWTEQELDVGVNGLAVPLPGVDGSAVTVSLFGPAYRLNPTDRPTTAERLVELVAARAPALLGDPA